jgi:hypothetical protein
MVKGSGKAAVADHCVILCDYLVKTYNAIGYGTKNRLFVGAGETVCVRWVPD